MVYLRGNQRDYDNWVEMGNPGWGWNDVVEYFKKSEDNTNSKYAQDKRYHATGGLLKVGNLGTNDEGHKRYLRKGFQEMGVKEIKVPNADEFLGYFDVQGTVDGGERFGAAKAFLASTKGRKNLHVIKHAHVTKLKFNNDGAVNGVTFALGETQMSVSAKKEVVLSAGTIGSPQILMLSGIGPRAELEKHQIEVKQSLPVGLNLQDHTLIPFGTAFHKSTAKPITPADFADFMYQFNIHRTGYLTSLGVADFTVLASTVNDTKYPDIQLHNLFYERQHPGLRSLLALFNLNNDIIDTFTQINEEASVTVWCLILLNPKSRGHISLATNSAFDAPKIYPNYLHEEEDVGVLVNGLKMLNRFSETKAFAKLEGQVVQAHLPDCDTFEYKSDEYWECYVRHMTTTVYHPVGTCKMGPLNGEATVVDPKLKVKGVKGLRVVDASIMPTVVSGNTNAPAIMIGEMGADLIKSDWMRRVHDEMR